MLPYLGQRLAAWSYQAAGPPLSPYIPLHRTPHTSMAKQGAAAVSAAGAAVAAVVLCTQVQTHQQLTCSLLSKQLKSRALSFCFAFTPASTKQTRRGQPEEFNKKIRIFFLSFLKIKSVGLSSVLSGDGGGDHSASSRLTLANDAAALCLLWAFFLNEGCEEVGKFQRLASGKDPAHSVETLGGSSAERGLPVNSASAEESRLPSAGAV